MHFDGVTLINMAILLSLTIAGLGTVSIVALTILIGYVILSWWSEDD